MLKALLVAVLLVLPALAQTSVVGPVYDATGGLVTGTVEVSWQAFVATGGQYVGRSRLTRQLVAGVITSTLGLYPNDTSTPAGTVYTVYYLVNGVRSGPYYWTVPTSGGSVTIAAIQSAEGGSNPNSNPWVLAGSTIYPLSTSYNVGIGGIPGAYKLDVVKSGASGTVRLYDQTASTGATTQYIRAGAGQSTTALVTLTNNANTAMSTVGSDGSFNVLGTTDGFRKIVLYGGTGSSDSILGLTSDARIQFRSGSAWDSGSVDTGMSRNAAGIVEVNNGTAGTYADARLRNLIFTSVAAIDSTLANSQCNLVLTSNTNVQVRCKGSDAAMRFVNITIAP